MKLEFESIVRLSCQLHNGIFGHKILQMMASYKRSKTLEGTVKTFIEKKDISSVILAGPIIRDCLGIFKFSLIKNPGIE